MNNKIQQFGNSKFIHSTQVLGTTVGFPIPSNTDTAFDTRTIGVDVESLTDTKLGMNIYVQ